MLPSGSSSTSVISPAVQMTSSAPWGGDFPRGPAFGEAVLHDQSPLDPVGGVALFIIGIPGHAVRGRFDGGGGVAAEMDELGFEAGHMIR